MFTARLRSVWSGTTLYLWANGADQLGKPGDIAEVTVLAETPSATSDGIWNLYPYTNGLLALADGNTKPGAYPRSLQPQGLNVVVTGPAPLPQTTPVPPPLLPTQCWSAIPGGPLPDGPNPPNTAFESVQVWLSQPASVSGGHVTPGEPGTPCYLDCQWPPAAWMLQPLVSAQEPVPWTPPAAYFATQYSGMSAGAMIRDLWNGLYGFMDVQGGLPQQEPWAGVATSVVLAWMVDFPRAYPSASDWSLYLPTLYGLWQNYCSDPPPVPFGQGNPQDASPPPAPPR